MSQLRLLKINLLLAFQIIVEQIRSHFARYWPVVLPIICFRELENKI